MCNQNIMLAQLNIEMFVTCCEHGTLHIYWKGTTVCIMPGGLAQMAQLLDQVDDTEHPLYLHQQNLTLTRFKQDCHYQLRLGIILLIIELDEFAELLKLLKTAWKKFLRVAPNLNLNVTPNFNSIGLFYSCIGLPHN